MSRKMRYLSERSNGDYRYVRDFPTKLLRAYPNHPKQFSRELGLNNTCSDSDLLKAMEEATRLYDLRVKTATNSDPNAFSDSELKMAVEEVLRQRNLKVGEYAHVPEKQYTEEEWKRAMEHGANIVPDRYDLAEQAIPEVEDVGDAEQRGEKLTFQQQVYVDAWKAVQQLPTIRKSWTMREAWRQYVSDNAIDVSKGDGRKKQQRFERVLKYTGDFMISSETEDEVLDRIQNFIYGKRQDNPTIKAQSIERELTEFIAAIRHVPRLKWGASLQISGNQNNFQVPKTTKAVQGRVLSDEELRICFNRWIYKQPDPKNTAMLLMIHAGLGCRELRRLRIHKDVFLDAKYPHIIFRGGDERIAKTDARPRVVPVVIGLEVIKEHLPETIAWMNSIDENSVSTTLNKRLRSLLGQDPELKSHGFRHTWLRMSRRIRISEDNKHAIAGWEKGDTNNTVMERVYDIHGYRDDPELLAQLYEDQKEIFSRFMVDASTLDNVVELKR
jgi:integrase